MSRVSDTGAAERFANQVGRTTLGDDSDDLTFGLEDVRVENTKRSFDQKREQALEAGQRLRMRGAACARSDDVAGNRKVDADDAVLVEAEFVETEHPGDDEAKRCKQERSGSLRVLGRLALSFIHSHRGVDERSTRRTIAQGIDQCVLLGGHVRRAAGTDQGNGAFGAQ